MNKSTPFGIADYPIAEKRPESVHASSGKPLAAITFEAVIAGEAGMADFAIDRAALLRQAEIARAASRPTLAQNFERAADLVGVPQEIVMRAYELLRPGRARSKDEICEMAGRLRDEFGASRIAAFLEEAAEVYERRGLFRFRY
jgi:propanediol dehydratase small subunit